MEGGGGGVVEEHEWEKCKENIKPLKGGRRIGEVLAALKNDTEYANKMIQTFEMQLRVLEDEVQLLEKWSEYISWTQQHFISSTHESLDLMKRCVKHFKNKPQFKSNDKFVKIWIKISGLTIEADDIFMYMFEQGIGTSMSLFYKEWATHHEIVGNQQRAREVLELGVNRDAQPMDDIKLFQSQFEWRMMKKRLAKESEGKDDEDDDGSVEGDRNSTSEGNGSSSSSSSSGAGRAPLNKLPSSKSGKVNSKRAKLQDITTTHGLISSSTHNDNSRKCSSASVFEILDESKTSLPTSSLFPTSSSSSSTISKKTVLPFHDGKENAVTMETMKRAKIKPTKAKPTSTSKPLAFSIYRDDEENRTTTRTTDEEEVDGCADNVFTSSSCVTLTSRKPLNSITSQVTDGNDMLQDLEQDTLDSKAVYMYQKEKVYMGINEVSPEELWAQMTKYKSKIPP